MFCSTIIPTIGRASLTRAVCSVLEQSFTADDFEVIVVNDSGQSLPPAEWQQSSRVRLIETQRRERSVARNTGAAIALGRYLHFLDDDDWLLPGAIDAFWALSQSSEAEWLYGGTQLVDSNGAHLIQLDHGIHGNIFVQAMSGEWIPLQSSLIKASAFFAIGGFNPLLTGPEDIDLERRMALRYNFAVTNSVVACVRMKPEDSTTKYEQHPMASRRARENILNEPGVFARMRASADSAYWQGRIVRAYLTSAVWNLRHQRGTTALSRTVLGAIGMALAVRHLVAKDFWRALACRYQSETFRRGFEQVISQ